MASHTRYLQAVSTFINIWGVGPVKANQLAQLGYHTIAALRRNQASLADRNLLDTNQLVGLRHYEDFLERIPRCGPPSRAVCVQCGC